MSGDCDGDFGFHQPPNDIARMGSSAVAYALYFRILAGAGATNLLLVTFLIPVSAILLGILVLGETLQTKHLLGMARIGSGLTAIDGRPWRALTGALRSRRLTASRRAGSR
jgi:EamA-like transporter family